MSDETQEYNDDDAHRIIEAMNQQARDILTFPPIVCNIVSGKHISLVFEFQRIDGTVMDATIVQLNFEQARIIQTFLNDELGQLTEQQLLRTMKEPTKENDDDFEEGSVPPASS